MIQIIYNRTTITLFCLLLIICGCTNEEVGADGSVMVKELEISDAKSWFTDYESKEEFHPIFVNLNYDWDAAAITILEDGSKAVTVPITVMNSNPGYKGERILYLYPFGETYDAVVYELNPDSNQATGEGFNKLESYNGYISSWDLKKGFIRAHQFADSKAIRTVFFEVLSEDDLKVRSATKKNEAPIELREVIVASGGGGGNYINFSYVVRGGSFGSGLNTGNYFGPPHGSGGSSNSTIDQPGDSPCDKMKKLLNNVNFKSRLDTLRLKTKLKKESGYSQDRNGDFTPLTTKGNGSDELDMPFDRNRIGFMHTHLNRYEKLNADGDLEPVNPIKMFSPRDVGLFLRIALNAQNSNIPVSDTYGVMVSSIGTYQLKFTGNVADISKKFGSINWGALDDIYERMIKTDGLEKGFLKFLKDIIGIDGIELFKMEATGNARKALDNTGETTSTNCN